MIDHSYILHLRREYVQLSRRLPESTFVGNLHSQFQDWVVPQQPEAMGLAMSNTHVDNLQDAWRTMKAAAGNARSNSEVRSTESHEQPGYEVGRKIMDLSPRSSSRTARGCVSAYLLFISSCTSRTHPSCYFPLFLAKSDTWYVAMQQTMRSIFQTSEAACLL